jgi:putative ABC transport system permease protein
VLLGAAAAWPVITLVFHTHWAVDWTGIVVVLAAVAAVGVCAGAVAAFAALARRPAPVLRTE